MPTVEAYGQQRVGTDPIAGQKKTAVLTPDAAGGQFGESLARLGSVGLEEVQKRQLAERQRANQLAEVSAERQFNQLDTVYLHSPDRGALNKGGREPMDLRDQYTKEWDASADEILKAATNPEQQLVLERMRDRRRASFNDRYDTHASNQFGAYEVGEVNAMLESSVNTAIRAVDEPAEQRVGIIAEQLATQRRTIETYADRLKLGPEGATQLMEKLASQTHVGVIQQLMAKQEDVAASEYFAEVEQAIAPAQAAQLKEQLETSSRDTQAFAAANEVFAELGPDPTDDVSPIELDRMEAKLREKFAKDPKGYKAAVQYLRDRKTGVDDARKERVNTRDSNLWTAVAANQPLSVVRNMSEFRLAPGAVQQRVVEFYRADADRDASRAAAIESRAASRDARAAAARNRAEQEREDSQWGNYFNLSNPTELAKMDRADILRRLPELGRAHTNRLLTDWEQYRASEAKVREATIDRELFQEVMSGAGYDWIYKTPGELTNKERAIAGRLQNAVEAEIAATQARPDVRRQLDREEKRKLFQSIVDKKVMVDRSLMLDYEAVAATVEDSERGQTYVPISKVPRDVQKLMVNYLRGLPSSRLSFGPPPTDEQVALRYTDRIQRAYARALLNGTDAEVNAILEGKED